jgi:hypothetical protein
MVALKQGPDDALVLTGANEVLVLMGVGDVLVELDDVLLELDKVLVEVDRVRVLALKVDAGACEDDEPVLAGVGILSTNEVVLSDTEDVVEEDLFPLPLPLPLPLLPLLPLSLPLPLLLLLLLPLPLPLLPLSFLANGLAAAHTPKRAAANRIGLTIVVCGVNGTGV